MKLPILDINGKRVGERELPEQFTEAFRPDLIWRAVITLQSNKRQPYGADPKAGKRYSAKLRKRRKKFKTTYGQGISRTPRKTVLRRGSRFYWIGAFAPQTVGGRRAHPPKSEKIWKRKINDQERKKAIRSALAACLNKEIVKQRGHLIPENYPFIIEDDVLGIKKTKEAVNLLKNLGFESELERTKIKKIRAGKGKSRGRQYKKRKGLLIIAGKKGALFDSIKNLSGTEITEVNNLNVELLAPGTQPGRMILLTQSAVDQLEKEKLFI